MPAKERPKLRYFQGLVTISRVSYLGFYFEFKAMMSCMLNVNQVLVPKYHKGTCTFAGELQQFSSQYFVFSLPMMIIQKSPLPIVAKKHSTWLLHFLLEIASVWHCEPLAASHMGGTILEWCNVKVQSWKTSFCAICHSEATYWNSHPSSQRGHGCLVKKGRDAVRSSQSLRQISHRFNPLLPPLAAVWSSTSLGLLGCQSLPCRKRLSSWRREGPGLGDT